MNRCACGVPARVVAAGACMVLAACSTETTRTVALQPPGLGVPASPKVVADGAPVPQGGGRYQVGRAYQVAGTWYAPKEDPHYNRVGVASWYGSDFHGRLTANGEIFDRTALMAAHPTMPLPSYARVTNLGNARSVIVRVNDRGPYSRTRLIDVSERTADLLGFKQNGMAVVRVEYVGKARMDGQDSAYLLASYKARDGVAQPGAGVMLASAETLPRKPAPSSRSVAAAMTASAAPSPGDTKPAAAAVAYAGESGAVAGRPATLAAADALNGAFSANDRIFMAFQSVPAGQ